jgi:hypothetical protein
MKYYIIVRRQRIYFDFSYAGFRAAQKWLLDHGLGSRKLHIHNPTR